MTAPSASSRIIKTTYLTFTALIAAWLGAWLLKVRLEESITWLAVGAGSFLYWTAAQILIWIVPAVWLIQRSGRTIHEVLGLSRWKSWLAWGGGIGLAIALTGIIPNYLAGNRILPDQISFPLLNMLVIAPLFEEFLLRGAIQGNLERAYPFWTANLITSVMFLILHGPGWFFMGVLWENFANPFGGALSIFLVSLGFGYAAHRSRSVLGGVVAHFLNNLF